MPIGAEKKNDDLQGAVNDMLAEAKAGGALKPLEDLVMEQGLGKSAEEVLLLAQKDERTRGKSPVELAKMLSEDPGLVDDLLGGGSEPAGMGEMPDEENPEEDAAEPAEEPGEKPNPFGGKGKAPPFGKKDNGTEERGEPAPEPEKDEAGDKALDDYAGGRPGTMKGVSTADIKAAIKKFPELAGMSVQEAIAAIEADPDLKARLMKVTTGDTEVDDGE